MTLDIDELDFGVGEFEKRKVIPKIVHAYRNLFEKLHAEVKTAKPDDLIPLFRKYSDRITADKRNGAQVGTLSVAVAYNAFVGMR